MKDVGLRIRVQRDLREAFLEICRAQDKPAAQVLREFMRAYVLEHESMSEDQPAQTKGTNTKMRGAGNSNIRKVRSLASKEAGE